MHSWRVLILPFMDQAPLFNQYRLDEPWNSPHNTVLAETIPPLYRCPSFVKYHGRHNLATREIGQLTNYVMVTAPGIRPALDGRGLALKDIADGSSNTILVIEARHHAVCWTQPDDASESEILIDLQSAANEHQANHLAGLHCVLADGSVRFLSSRIDPTVFHGLVTPNGGEPTCDF